MRENRMESRLELHLAGKRFKGLSWSFQGLLSVLPVRNIAGCSLWHRMGTVTSDRIFRRAQSQLGSLWKC